MRPPEAGPDGKLYVGALLRDWALKPGMVREVVQLWRSEDVIVDAVGVYRGSSAERCALHGGPAHWKDDEDAA